MRITGGAAKGIELRVPGKGRTRPATDRMREAVFSSLGDVSGMRFIDLFAGSGAYGLEAWSRGATSGVFVEQHRATLNALNTNIREVAKSLGKDSANVTATTGDALRWQPPDKPAADLVFVDPPYDAIEKLAPLLFENIAGYLAPNGRVVFEMPGQFDFVPAGWILQKRIGKGKNEPTCAIYRTETA